MRSVSLASVLAVLAAPAAAPSHAADAPVQQPHRAVYSMALANASGVGGPAQVRGAMVYEVLDGCDAWRVDTKVMMLTAYGEEEVESVRLMSSWEAKDGLSFRFKVDEKTGGKPGESLRGVAVLDGPGLPGVAEFTRPQPQKVELPKGTAFPTTHMIEMIQRAQAGERHFGKVVFDGSTLEDPYVVSAVIGPAPASKLAPEVAAALRKADGGEHPRWEGRLAYFSVQKKTETPDFELTVVFRDDGVIEAIRQDYEDHSVDSRLRQVELLPLAVCPATDDPPSLPDADEPPAEPTP